MINNAAIFSCKPCILQRNLPMIKSDRSSEEGSLTPIEHDDLQDVIERLIKGSFRDGDIRQVLIREGEENDNEQLVEITVVFNGAIDEIADRTPLGLLRELRNAVGKHVEHGFPFLNFMPASELVA